MRLLNRPLAFILAVALAAACIVLITDVIGFAAHAAPLIVPWTTWYHWAEKTRWNTLVVRVWLAILIAAGALILTLEFKPRRVSRLSLHSEDKATDAALTRSGLAGTLRAAATGIDGVSEAAVSIRRRRARVVARAAARDRAATDALRAPVTEALRARLDELNLRRPPRLKVHVTPRSR